jgi:hypothetical protein
MTKLIFMQVIAFFRYKKHTASAPQALWLMQGSSPAIYHILMSSSTTPAMKRDCNSLIHGWMNNQRHQISPAEESITSVLALSSIWTHSFSFLAASCIASAVAAFAINLATWPKKQQEPISN